jgi:hypothetical protein
MPRIGCVHPQHMGYPCPLLGFRLSGSGAAVGLKAHELPRVPGVHSQRRRGGGPALRDVPAIRATRTALVDRDVPDGGLLLRRVVATVATARVTRSKSGGNRRSSRGDDPLPNEPRARLAAFPVGEPLT